MSASAEPQRASEPQGLPEAPATEDSPRVVPPLEPLPAPAVAGPDGEAPVVAAASIAEAVSNVTPPQDVGPTPKPPQAVVDPNVAVDREIDRRAKSPPPEAQRLQEQMRGAADPLQPALGARRSLGSVVEPLRLGTPQFEADGYGVRTWVARLQTERILVLASASWLVLESALHAITEDELLRSSTRKLKVKLGTSSELADSFELCCLPDERGWAETPDDTLLVVEVTAAWSRAFLDDLFRDPVTQRTARCATLERLNRRLVVLTTPDMLSERERGFAHGGGALPCFHLPFQRPLIDLEFAGQDDAFRQRMLEAFESQRAAGHWGTTDQQHHDEFIARASSRTLQAALEAALGEPPPSLGPDVLVNSLLFVVCFLNKLGPSEVQDVLLRLVGDELDPSWKATQPGETPRLLKDRWRAQSHALLKAEGLRIGSGRERVLLFEHGTIEARKSAFREQQFFFFEELRQRLERLELLFDSRVSVADVAIAFFAETAINDASCDEAWLLRLLGPALRDEAVAPAVISNRMDASARLLRQLLAQGQTGLVEKVLVRLCEAGRHDVLLKLTQRLTSAPSFDELQWVQRCLDQAGTEVADAAYAHLLCLALRPGSNAVSGCAAWVKPDGANPSRAQLAALKLCVELAELTLWAPDLTAVTERGLPCLTEPAAVAAALQLSLDERVDASSAAEERWLFQLKKLIDVWLVPERIAELAGASVTDLRLHLIATWLMAGSYERDVPPQRGVLQALLLGSAALALPRARHAELAQCTGSVLAPSRLRPLRAAIDVRLRCIEDCLSAVVACVDARAPSFDEERARRTEWRTLRRELGARRALLGSYRAALRGAVIQPRSVDHAQPD